MKKRDMTDLTSDLHMVLREASKLKEVTTFAFACEFGTDLATVAMAGEIEDIIRILENSLIEAKKKRTIH